MFHNLYNMLSMEATMNTYRKQSESLKYVQKYGSELEKEVKNYLMLELLRQGKT